jgi:hypothetical protein
VAFQLHELINYFVPRFVVGTDYILPWIVHQYLSFSQVVEDLTVKQFIPQSSVE